LSKRAERAILAANRPEFGGMSVYVDPFISKDILPTKNYFGMTTTGFAMSLSAFTTRAVKARPFALSLGAVGLLSASAVVVHAPGVLFNLGVRNLDFNTHYVWTIQFAEGLRNGDVYPHWMWRGHLGLGEVALLFYSPLFYYVCSAVRLLTPNTWDAMRIVFVLSTILSGFYGWRLLRLFTGDVYALAGGVLLQWAPMIFMLFYYFNGFPWAVGFAALVALTYYALRPGAFERWIDVRVSIAIAALVLTHLVSALMALICFSFMCFCFFRRAERGWRAARHTVSWFVSAGAGLALSMFYLLPALWGMHLISPKVWTTSFTPWNAFVFPTVTALAFGVRWFTFQWTVPAVVLLGVLAATWHTRGGSALSVRFGEALMVTLVVSWVSLFFASELSYPLWLMNTPLRLIQFPHRFIYVTSATGAIANLLVLWDLRRAGRASWRKLITALPMVLGFAATVMLSAKLSIIDGKPHHLSDDDTNPYPGLPEYRLAAQGPYWQDYYRAGGLAAECAEKMLACRTVETNSHVQAWDISAAQPARLRLPLFDFPAWRVMVDGTSVPTSVDAATGLISLDLPAGTHRVTALWRRLAAERSGLIITGLTVLVLAALASAPRLQRFVRPVPQNPA
jgi:hypothetical protein